MVKGAVRRRVLPKEILNLFWQDSRLAPHFSLQRMGMVDDAILLCFDFPGHLGCMVLGARTALVALWTLLKSLKCDCSKIIRRNQEHIHILVTMQSGKEEGRKYEVLLKSCQHRSKHKRCLKWEHTSEARRNYEYTSCPCVKACSQLSFYDILFTLPKHFLFFDSASQKSHLGPHCISVQLEGVFFS